MSYTEEKLRGTAFLCFSGMKELLLSELKERFSFDTDTAVHYGDLLYFKNYEISSPDDEKIPYWASTCIIEPVVIHFDSIADAASALRQKYRSWAPYQYNYFRRAALIQDKLPYVNLKPRTFPAKLPASVTGLYTLIDEHTMIAGENTTSVLPAGRLVFEEDHENPPSRAYLKIQESLSLASHLFNVPLPCKGSRCFEAGACPGDWTWVLAGLGSEVFAVDRSELAPSLMKNPLVQFKAHDAFTIPCEEIGNCDWVLSDVICYPERLLEWIQKWLSSGLVKNMICTIKMQGKIDWPLVARFAAIPDSRVIHLNYNKHELTFIHCEK